MVLDGGGADGALWRGWEVGREDRDGWESRLWFRKLLRLETWVGPVLCVELVG
jgi:hypothetical protein